MLIPVPANEASDYELLEAWRAGDATAGNLLVRRHFAVIYGFLRSKAHESVDELVQNTFLGCVEAVDRIDPNRSFRAYLFGIARRQLIYHYRKRRADGDRFDAMITSVRDVGGSPSHFAAARQEQRLVLDALHDLPLDMQITLELHYWEHMTVAEVADVLEVPPGTIKSRLHRGRELLRERLTQLGAPSEVTESSLDHLRALESARPRPPED
jgi:RNA polymerase sigma-70 factor (ECF subfamily)